jgi:hypothetical protein
MTPKKETSIENKKEEEEKKVEILQDKISLDNKEKSENSFSKFIKNSSHPLICFFTVLFKILCIISFLILNWFTKKSSVIYLTTVLFGSADFWVTKNLSGRLLVGLRWWNEVKENGEEVWIFESKNEKKEASSDKIVFWFSLYGFNIIWLCLIIANLITLNPARTIIAIVIFVFASVNLYGYFKCSKEQQNKLKSYGGKLAINAIKKGAKTTMEMANEQQNNKNQE